MSTYGEFWLCGLGILVSLLLRVCTSLHPYSGEGVGPLFGDYEAQRHWMEITTNLPVKDWYRNTTNNDLLYWGLDYPPLTAFHMFVCGIISKLINPEFVELGKSRGHESEGHKLFMRYTVLISDLVVYFPSVCAYFFALNKVCKGGKKTEVKIPQMSYGVCIVISLLYPGLILIDHGHFQYNCVSLGLNILAITFILCGRHIWAAILFSLALNYKQMLLYHSLPYFIYLLSICISQNLKNSFKKLIKIALTVLVTFALCWLPFLANDVTYDVILRLFPLSRGVFEDKVSNFWCALNVFYKFRVHFNHFELARLCMLATLAAVLPTCIDLFLRPSVKKFIPALINSSLAFFLFSFQVHEKSILIVAVVVILYFPEKPVICFWFLCISTFSLTPLIIKDKLIIPFISLNLFYFAAFAIAIKYTFKSAKIVKTSHLLLSLFNFQDGAQDGRQNGGHLAQTSIAFKHLLKNKKQLKMIVLYLVFYLSLLGCILLFVLAALAPPPRKYPDLYPLLCSLYSCGHFVIFFVYFNICQFKIKQDYVEFKFKHD